MTARRYTEPRRTMPLDYTGTRYSDEFDTGADADLPLSCTCYDPISMEFGPDYPCAYCARLNDEGIPT